MFMKLYPILAALEEGLKDQGARERVESALEFALDNLAKLTPDTTVLGRACAAALKVLHEGEAIAGDPSTGGSPASPADTLK